MLPQYVICPQCLGKDDFCTFCNGEFNVTSTQDREWKEQNLDSNTFFPLVHTPGPWLINRETEENLINIEPGIGCAFGLGKTPEANARLIAAAPELLNACLRAVERLRLANNGHKPRQGFLRVGDIEDAIAKAVRP